jgi:hypothetical protein
MKPELFIPKNSSTQNQEKLVESVKLEECDEVKETPSKQPRIIHYKRNSNLQDEKYYPCCHSLVEINDTNCVFNFQ